MNYTPILSERALQQMNRIPAAALKALGEIMAVVCEDPYQPFVTKQADDSPHARWTYFGAGRGVVTYVVIDSALIVRVTDITWVG